MYLGAPKGVPITAPPYTIYIVAESPYDVMVKIEAIVHPDPSTGRLTVTVDNATHPFNLPQLPFSKAILELNQGPRAPLANPLGCGSVITQSLFNAYSGRRDRQTGHALVPVRHDGLPGDDPLLDRAGDV